MKQVGDKVYTDFIIYTEKDLVNTYELQKKLASDLCGEIWKYVEEGLNELKDQLRKIDNQLLKDKDNAELEVKDFQKTTIKCKFGDLEFYRRRYKLTKK